MPSDVAQSDQDPQKRRQEIAQLLETLVEKHPTGAIYVTWDNANAHEDEDIDAIVQATQGRLVLLYLPTYSPWFNPINEWFLVNRKNHAPLLPICAFISVPMQTRAPLFPSDYPLTTSPRYRLSCRLTFREQ
ncbi:transposase [Ktedonospora formicarum]|uniref:transposase n=1 Tax=Ktedonospora formicarum TaxID=2778364 RepID=UPI001C68FF7B|nr:transposase [Ktedonospora formicarum]